MVESLAARYAEQLDQMRRLVDEELGRWPWPAVPEMGKLVRAQVGRQGKRLRPLLMFALTDALGGDFQRVVPAAAGVELHHLASLILDDVQDNSAFRRGAPAVHTTCGVSNAINLAGIVRNLAWQPLARSTALEPAEKLAVQERVGTAAMHLYLGQSIDIGWHQGWYPTIAGFPHQQMITWKTGALFGCAAWLAAFLSGAHQAIVTSADTFGAQAGVLFQLADDYVDFFTPRSADGVSSVPEDLRGGKPTWPLIALCEVLTARGDGAMAETVVRRLREADTETADWSWLLALAFDLGLPRSLWSELHGRARDLADHARKLDSDRGGDAGRMEQFTHLLVGSARIPAGSGNS
jgi:octaprenyl-diphosphate synthase